MRQRYQYVILFFILRIYEGGFIFKNISWTRYFENVKGFFIIISYSFQSLYNFQLKFLGTFSNVINYNWWHFYDDVLKFKYVFQEFIVPQTKKNLKKVNKINGRDDTINESRI